jgi:hypothetical protein
VSHVHDACISRLGIAWMRCTWITNECSCSECDTGSVMRLAQLERGDARKGGNARVGHVLFTGTACTLGSLRINGGRSRPANPRVSAKSSADAPPAKQERLQGYMASKARDAFAEPPLPGFCKVQASGVLARCSRHARFAAHPSGKVQAGLRSAEGALRLEYVSTKIKKRRVALAAPTKYEFDMHRYPGTAAG